jgi:hypothetical protein
VLLNVFLDPDAFTPHVGSTVLLVGVKNHRAEEGSLRKYESDRLRGGRAWWFEDPWEMEWCDVAGLKKWRYTKTQGEERGGSARSSISQT